ncbi:nuclear transport factor 2 family protein [Acetobacter sicerae]|uniref:Nuclear transport factor 2 family protein n=1 Tax=Acetobacter sicerae TaxID=85325 RepID=A0ABS8VY29_9PROT|nr:nuclear transport factor 2 family protein [Acetobacter sicerae]MCE0745061.1 nuclear transport factor 2 family protein [Acetobacter sicerae]
MTGTAKKLVERWYETGDTALLAENIVWDVLATFPEGGQYVGRQAVEKQFFPRIKSHFSDYVTHPYSFTAEGNIVATTGVYRVRTRQGQSADIAFAHFWTVRDDHISALHQVADTAAIQKLLVAGEQAS